jgi:Staphylococcal nuclease homologue.
MIKAGMAWHSKKYSSDKEYADSETQARRKKIGLWIDANPIAPWDWRKHPEKTSWSK